MFVPQHALHANVVQRDEVQLSGPSLTWASVVEASLGLGT